MSTPPRAIEPGRLRHILDVLRSALLQRATPATGLYLVSFGGSKLLTYLVPLMLAAILPAADYVAVEYALAMGAIGGMVLGLGLPSAIPQFEIYRRPPVRLFDLANLQAGVLSILLVLIAGVMTALGGSPASALIPLMMAAYMFQYAWYNHALTLGRPSAAVWFSNMATLVALAAGLASWTFAAGRAPLAAGGILSAVLVLAFGGWAIAHGLRTGASNGAERLISALKFGIPVAINGMVATWMITIIRIYSGWALPTEKAAGLLLDFRVASVLIIVHQLVSIALFRHLYVVNARRFDRWLAAYLGASVMVALAFNAIIETPLVSSWIPRPEGQSTPHIGVATFFIVLWSITAFIDNLVNRSGAALRSAAINAGAAAICAGLIWVNRDSGLSPEVIGLICCAQLTLTILIQTAVLARGERPWRTALGVCLTLAGLIVVAWAGA